MIERSFPCRIRFGLLFSSTIGLIGLIGCKANTPDEGGKDGKGPPGLTQVEGEPAASCERTVVAEVAVVSQQLVYNRLGANQTASTIFALARDIEVKRQTDADWQWLIDTPEWQAYQSCRADGAECLTELQKVAMTYSAFAPLDGNVDTYRYVRVRSDHRPRPLVLRANVGDCLEVNLANLLPTAPESTAGAVQSNFVGFHPAGMQLVSSSDNDGQIVGKNPNAVAASVLMSEDGKPAPLPDAARQYKYFASNEAVHFLSSSTDNNDGQLNAGLFGAVHVQPRGAEYYRSQVTEYDLRLAETGKNPDGTPTINYQATFPTAAPAGDLPLPPWKGASVPILNMLRDAGNGRHELIYADLNAIITGPNTGPFVGESPVFAANPASPDRRDPYREFTVIYHEPGATAQAFAQIFDDPELQNTANAGEDLFGINYGTGGIGAEILANRLGVGPMGDCADCRYEEFFLSAWTVGDPAMNVDIPASAIYDGVASGSLPAGSKAQVAYFPDDPSNVHHSYIGDHVKMRVHHGGAIHHLHHLHAHQWLHSPNSDDGHYLDSQLIGPGASFTNEIAYNGSGNRNQTVGDSIFHCHFYPHFAQGMWSMWRVHDVFEAGTKLEEVELQFWGQPKKFLVPAAGSRALPDGEIARGTPIPALVPVPTRPIAPLPSPIYIADGQTHYGAPPTDGSPGDRWGDTVTTNPGFPFFIPGNAGERPPQPPLDMAVLDGKSLDGGLPRHVMLGGDKITQYQNRYDWSRFTNEYDALELEHDGVPVEKVAMAAHAQRKHPSFTPEGQPADFIYNGMAPQPGAPFADPCFDVDPACLASNGGDSSQCDPVPVITPQNPLRHYKGADIQHDVVLNKDGWHYPQQRLAVLWNDIQPTFDNSRPPQPFFIRANSRQCIEYWMTNLVPNYYEVDNFQVRTPTDILGQHIHLVKFDVTSSDGAANGFNYEDGTLSYEEVQERIEAINEGGGLKPRDGSAAKTLEAQTPEYLCAAGVKNCDEFKGAQTTVQRWWADPLLNNAGHDRTIRTVFTHDHFGPSTHQQAGLYAGLLVEHEGSKWWDAEVAGLELGGGKNADGTTRDDGGPTSWQAVITNADQTDGFREFALEFQDGALAYAKGGTHEATPYPKKNMTLSADDALALSAKLDGIEPTDGASVRKLVGGYIYDSKDPDSSKPIAAPITPQLLNSPFQALWGTYGVNYRHEPLAFRANNDDDATDSNFGACNAGELNCDNAYLYQSIARHEPHMNTQHVGEKGFPPALTSGVYGWDPFTPMLRAYEGEKIQIRTLVGAHVQQHNFMTHGFAWLFEPGNPRSGYRDSQSMGISEHFEMEFTMPPASRGKVPAEAGAPTNTCGQEPSAEQAFADYLYTPSSTIAGQLNGNWGLIRSYAKGTAQCLSAVPSTPPAATGVAWACPPGAPQRVFKVTAHNAKLDYNERDKISNPHGLVYVGCDATGGDCLPPAIIGPDTEPMVLRAAAGECITVTLTNKFDPNAPVFTSSNTPLAAPGTFFQDSVTFATVTANPSTHVGLHPQMLAYDASNNGLNVGFNYSRTTTTAGPKQSALYTWYAGIIGADGTGTPVEFGVVNLLTADPLLQTGFGLAGALVVEPQGSTWDLDNTSPVSTVMLADGSSFLDVVLITIDGVVAQIDETSGTVPVNVVLGNYGTEPLAERLEGKIANVACQYSNMLVGGDPKTPIFSASPEQPVRFRVVHPWGNDQQVFELFGHLWQEEPYNDGSTVIAMNPSSEYQGFRAGWGATDRLNVILDDGITGGAGGPFGVQGDYLYRLRDVNLQATNGMWGLFRVGGSALPPPPVAYCIGAKPSAQFEEFAHELVLIANDATVERVVSPFVPRLPSPVAP
jgi:hypothetical protein